MEIERKYLINHLPDQLDQFPHRTIEQGYLCTEPVVRVRRDGDTYILTYKSKGFLAREEHNLPLTKEAYQHLISKADGQIITKERYCIPLTEVLTIELDIFTGNLAPLCLAEVEFTTLEEANAFIPPEWFGEDVTHLPDYQNSTLSKSSDSRSWSQP